MTRLLSAALGVVIVVIVVLALAGTFSSSSDHAKTNAARTAAKVAARNVSAAYAEFSVLHSHATSFAWHRIHVAGQMLAVPTIGASLPASQSPLAEWASNNSSTDGAPLTPDTIVTLVTIEHGVQAYAYVTAIGHLCVEGLDPPGGGGITIGCANAPTAAIRGSGFIKGAIRSDKAINGGIRNTTEVFVLPNGVSSMTFIDEATHRSTVVPVHANVAAYSTPDPLGGYFIGTDGKRETLPIVTAQ